ncbi:MAG: ArsA-related P-loop ATPase, partial [bacterium]|nr:ArsA-related P-loop ATPase [bacterium]
MKSKNARLFLFGGKGGVGKTTCSAAIAVKLASEGIKTLHITSDMAPSLSDIYGIKIGDRITGVAPELDAMEITQDSIGAAWKKKFGPDFAEILSHILDMDGMRKEGDLDLLDYIGTAPSLREETLLDMIVEMARAGSYRRIIWDTAPAGETLNLLHMPRLMRKHLKAGAKLYEAVDRLAGAVVRKRSLASIMEEWVVRSEKIALFLQFNTLFFIVANPEALVVRQAS